MLCLSWTGEITQQEVSSFSRLATLANVIPLIGKSDMLDRPGIITLKRHILEKLQDSDAKPFLFGSTIDSSLTLAYNEGLKGDLPAPQSQSQAAEHTAETSNNISSETSNNEVTEPIAFFPYLISSAPGPDLDTMDASLLMSSDYCPPPVPSELHRLVQLLFDPEKAAWLRHTAARKFIAWRREKTNSIEIDRQNPFKLGDVAGYTTEGANLFASSTAGGLTPNLGLRSLAQRNASGAMSPRSIVPRWAASLTKALRNEREREGKTAWNDEGAGAPDLELQDSGLDLDLLSRKDSKEKRKLSKLSRKSTRHWSDAITPRASQTLKKHERDPLDVLSAVEKVSSVAWTAVKVIGAVSAAGAVACFVARRFFGVESITVHWQW